MEQLSINTIKIALYSLTYQKVPNRPVKNICIYSYKNRNEKYIYYQYKYKLTI